MNDPRVRKLTKSELCHGTFVLYRMQAAQRIEYNHALKFAIEKANELNLPLLVLFCLVENYPSANYRHYKFMLEGLSELPAKFAKLGVNFLILKTQSPIDTILHLSYKSSCIILDRGYTKIQKEWAETVAKNVTCPVYQVESEVIVPVELASNKEEYSAGTLRPKIWEHADRFLSEKFMLPELKIKKSLTINHKDKEIDIADPIKVLEKLKIDNSVSSAKFAGGYSEAKKWLKIFVTEKLSEYAKFARDPSKNVISNLSPYLHFGQISPLEVAQEVMKDPQSKAFIEELLVRRELAINFVNYNPNYTNFASLPQWAKETLSKHQNDKREYIYSEDEMLNADTHDKYWNACQLEMLKTGKMHSYMRMYWGKKIIEWTKYPEEAYELMIKLNDKYELDGRDPNGYAGIAWCFGKHDRPWIERKIFGKVRYMSASGLERKFDMEKYLQRVNSV